MSSLFPNQLDDSSTLPTTKTNATLTKDDHPPHHNNLATAVISIETVLGTNPNGPYSTVKAAITNKVDLTPGADQILQATGDFIGLVVKGNSAQNSKHIFEVRKSDDTIYAYVDKNGALSALSYKVGGVALASTHLSDASAIAYLASPIFTGTPQAPTVASSGDSSTKIATTAFVQNAIAGQGGSITSLQTQVNNKVDKTPAAEQVVQATADVVGLVVKAASAQNTTNVFEMRKSDGTVGVSIDKNGSLNVLSLKINGVDSSVFARLASPTFTGSPTAPTPTTGDNSTKIATTAFVVGAISSQAVPSGVMVEFAGTVAPSGWLLCNGAAVSRSTYAALFSAISTTYGVGDGSTTFNIPDRRGVVGVGYKSGDATFGTLGGSGGEKTHVLTATEMPSHTHAVTDPGHNHTYTNPGASKGTGESGGVSGPNSTQHTGTATTGITIAAAGSDGAHNNLQPYLVVNYIIKT